MECREQAIAGCLFFYTSMSLQGIVGQSRVLHGPASIASPFVQSTSLATSYRQPA